MNIPSTDVSNTDIESTQLFQNTPNPLFKNTHIKFQILQTVNAAMLYIHDLQGIEIKSYKIANRGEGSITIQDYELKAGMYIYSLVIDG